VGLPVHHRLQLRHRARPGLGREGYTAASIDPLARGVSWLLSETGVPRRIKAAYLTDADIKHLAAYAAQLRRKDPA
jgi:S-DNA-T family DNA segregation ATPase FtsK/SpoIIIE